MLDRNRLPTPEAYFDQFEGRRYGKSIRLRCPIHGGSSPTLSVDAESGKWLCFSCGAKGGDVVAFEMQHKGIGFVAAAKELGAWTEDATGKSEPDAFRINHKEALTILSLEVVILAQESARIRAGQVITDEDLDRILLAAGRIQGVCADLGLYRTKEKQ